VLGKAVYQFKNTNTRLQKLSNAYLYTSRTAGREIDRSSMRNAKWKKTTQTLSGKSTKLYHSAEINEPYSVL
jgi:hypothetical protein